MAASHREANVAMGREKRLRWRGSSVVGLKECTEEASRSEEVRNGAEPTRLSRFLLACGPPLEEVGVADGFHPECDGSSLSLSTSSCPRTALDGSWMFGPAGTFPSCCYVGSW